MALHKDHFLFVCLETSPGFFQACCVLNRRKNQLLVALSLIALCQVSVKRINNSATATTRNFLEVLFSLFSVNEVWEISRNSKGKQLRCRHFLVKVQVWLKTLLKKGMCFFWVMQFRKVIPHNNSTVPVL